MNISDNDTFQRAVCDLERKNRACKVSPYLDRVRETLKAIKNQTEHLQGAQLMFSAFEEYLRIYVTTLEAPLGTQEDEPWFPILEFALNLLGALQDVEEDIRVQMEDEVVRTFLSTAVGRKYD